MAENSKIEWTTHTFNPWRGCTKVSAGCANCYADTLSKRNPKTLGVWGPNGSRVVAAESAWREPLKWNRLAKAAGERHRVFCASLADVFEDWRGPIKNAAGDPLFRNTLRDEPWNDGNNDKPGAYSSLTMSDVRMRLFETINATPNLDWLLLTKRPENHPHMLPDRWLDIKWPDNVWVGVSVEDQAAADARIPHLMRAPAPVRFLSVEPLLGPIDLAWHLRPAGTETAPNWVIIGGESGHGARPCNVKWVRSLVEQCKAANVACFVKQLGARPDGLENIVRWPDEGPTSTLRDKKGGDINEFPADLRVRQFPNEWAHQY
jgi:protein gp37